MTQSTMPAPSELRPVPGSVPDATIPNAALYASADYFRAEMEALAASSWQFVCTTDELTNANDWVRRKVFGVDLFVQNFRGELRGYHNVCQHRGFPLRQTPSGNGTVQCYFHGWAYDPDGVPIGVPRNKELFCLSREQQARLAIPPVRVATVGRFVFVALQGAVPPLEQFLGRYAALLRALSNHMRSVRYRYTGPVRANWKLSYEVTLDDYHVSFVHSTTLGAEPVPANTHFYDREGHHSHMFARRDAHWQFSSFWDQVSQGTFDVTGYKIHHLFPNLLVAVSYRMVLISLFSPQGPEATELSDIIFDLDGDEIHESWWEEFSRTRRNVSDEDRIISEAQQETIAQLTRPPTYGALEQRVGWFHESYETLVGAEARRRLER